ncbi:MAG: sensor domain-containing diguanylate cyclase [Parabacteroides sp.]|nr:sensor domain-containing diguanylate cyclase [Parabacteroides sp.]
MSILAHGDCPMRKYNYNQDDFQGLFVRVVEKLSAPEATTELVRSTLTEICEHFKFGCGVIYEKDHAGNFHLKESYSSYDNPDIRHTLRLDKFLNNRSLEDSLKEPVYISLFWTGEDFKQTQIYQMFGANTILLVPIIDDDSTLIGLVGMMDRRHNILLREQDVHVAETVLRLLANYIKMRIYQHKVEMAQQSLSNTLDNMGIDIYVNDFYTHEILYVNKSMAAPYGGLQNMLGRKCWKAIYDDKNGQCEYCPQLKLIDEYGYPSKVYSWDYQRPFDGSWFRVFSAAFSWVDGRLAHVVSSVDITENKRNEALVTQMANYDALTTLPNRRKLEAAFDDILIHADVENNVNASLLFFDLDNFKSINDTMGHQAGDALLIEVGKELSSNNLTAEHIYRYGGDEFVLLYENHNQRQVRQVVDYLLTRFNKPWKVGAYDIICRTSIGVSFFPDDGLTIDSVITKADQMMYEAKKQGKGAAYFTNGEIIKPPKPHTSVVHKRK